MRKNICLLLILVILFTFFGCESDYDISGLENFNENACSIGLNDQLLPGDSQFLSDYPYKNGDYHYWTDGNYQKAKTFVMLQYSDSVYQEAKSACEDFYSFSTIQYRLNGFIFSQPNDVFPSSEYELSAVQMLGYNNDTCTLIFIGFSGYEINRNEMIDESSLAEFFVNEFGEYLT